MKTRYICYNDGGNLVLIDVATLPRVEQKAPAIHQDSMQPLWHPTTGKMFDSVSSFRAETKRTGGIELGNDVMPPKQRKPRTLLSSREHLEKNYQLQKNGALPKPAPAESIAAFEKQFGAVCPKS